MDSTNLQDTHLRASEQLVQVEGILADLDLKKDRTKDNSDDVITGSVTIKVGDNQIRFQTYVTSKIKQGDSNSAYKGLETVMDQYKPISKFGEEEADRVSVNRGSLNFYTSQNGTDAMGYRAQYFNRIADASKYHPKAEFSVEMYISNIVSEMDKEGNETGRMLIKGWTVSYAGGVDPITVVVPKEFADNVESTYSIGQTAEFFGNIINSRVEKITEVQVAFGAKQKVETSYKNELLVTSGSLPYEEGVTSVAPYPAETIKAAIQERENKKQYEFQKKIDQANPYNRNEPQPSGAAKGRTLSW